MGLQTDCPDWKRLPVLSTSALLSPSTSATGKRPERLSYSNACRCWHTETLQSPHRLQGEHKTLKDICQGLYSRHNDLRRRNFGPCADSRRFSVTITCTVPRDPNLANGTLTICRTKYAHTEYIALEFTHELTQRDTDPVLPQDITLGLADALPLTTSTHAM